MKTQNAIPTEAIVSPGSGQKGLASATTPLLARRPSYQMLSWTCAKEDRQGRQFPQTVAHRGYKAKFPENTMGAFKGAVDVGANAIETDLHLSKDGVVVISHDATLKRCFGVDKKIIDCDWDYLSTLRTLDSPHEQMPRLKDLLEYIAYPGNEHLWLLLDIKPDDDKDDIMRLISETTKSVAPSKARPWEKRLLLGCWGKDYFPYCQRYLPDFPIAHIGFSIPYARQFLPVPNVSFNMLQPVMMTPCGAKFFRDVKAAGRALFVWTVNENNVMKWSIRKKVDGVLTDDPKKFRKICEEWDDDDHSEESFTWRQRTVFVMINLFAFIIGIAMRFKHPADIMKFISKLNRQST